MHVLTKFKANWANEFEVKSFAAYKNTTVAAQTERIQNLLNSHKHFCFGSNGGFENGELTIDNYSFTEINDDEYATLAKHFTAYRDQVIFSTGAVVFG